MPIARVPAVGTSGLQKVSGTVDDDVLELIERAKLLAGSLQILCESDDVMNTLEFIDVPGEGYTYDALKEWNDFVNETELGHLFK